MNGTVFKSKEIKEWECRMYFIHTELQVSNLLWTTQMGQNYIRNF